ncbi:hypothetical protein [Dyadobacter sp. CY312]|uniref:hypothetical protein n=1 Tax=Dyadobacter sp. CY312 TaxID=2907303 RepID=UPI001F2E23FB|nr:hypothetical protein [Dyadobacter sp. CY312]MCE7042675.1 hypothetical protein [Dyadobacter sp. CY312]
MNKHTISQSKPPFNENGQVFMQGLLCRKETTELNERISLFVKDILPTMPEQYAFYENRGDFATQKQLLQMTDYDPFFEKLLNGFYFGDNGPVVKHMEPAVSGIVGPLCICIIAVKY